MWLGEVNTTSARPADSAACPPEDREHLRVAQSRALVPTSAAEPQRTTASGNHPYAPFLAQLLATKNGLPQTRERRRAEPHEAMAAYRATASRI